MNEDRKKFEESIKNLAKLKSSFESSAELKVIGKEKSVEEKLQDLNAYIGEDIDLSASEAGKSSLK